MIYLVTGVPGAGKTLRAIQLAHKWLKENPDSALCSNVNGWKRGAEIPTPWMEVEAPALLVIDEVQERWRRYSSTGAPPEEIASLERHRHRGVDFLLTCQNPKQLSVDVRALVEIHEHLTPVARRAGWVNLHRWRGRCEGDPGKALRAPDVEVEVYRHPKWIFNEYTSAAAHTGKRVLPRALTTTAPAAIIFAVVALGFAVHQVRSAFAGGKDDATTGQGVAVAAGAADTSSVPGPATVPPAPATATATGVMSHGPAHCVLTDEQGRRLPVAAATCWNALEHGVPREVRVLDLE